MEEQNFPVDDGIQNVENYTATLTRGMKSETQKSSALEINHFFNELPVRIIGTQNFPVFYADDIAKILNIKRARESVANFGEMEIVTPEQRKQYGLVTYRKYKDTVRRDDKIILLTEFGVYRMIFGSNSQLASQFRKWIYTVLHDLRTKGVYRVEQELQQLNIVNKELQEKVEYQAQLIDVLQARQKKFENLTDKLYVLEIPNNPRLITQYNVTTEDLPSDPEDIDEDENTIDNWELYCKMFPDPADRTPPYTYKLTSVITPIDRTTFDLRYEAYVRNANNTLQQLDNRLVSYRVNTAPHAHYYECHIEKIIDAIDDVAINDV